MAYGENVTIYHVYAGADSATISLTIQKNRERNPHTLCYDSGLCPKKYFYIKFWWEKKVTTIFYL